MSKKKPTKTTKPRLGKGLSALLREAEISDADSLSLGRVDAKDAAMKRQAEVVEVPLERIRPSSDQPRSFFDEDKIQELSLSIKQYGVIEPILIRQVTSDVHGAAQYELIAGERRWRASKLSGIKTVPCIVREYQHNLEVMLIENIQRADLTPIEEARSYEMILSRRQITQEALSKQVGKSRAHIANMLRLLRLPRFVLDAINQGTLSAGHAKILLAFKEEDILNAAKTVIEQSLSVRQLETLLKAAQQAPSKGAWRASVSLAQEGVLPKKPHILDVENVLRSALQTKVIVKQKKDNGPGLIEIEFYNDEDLDRFIERLT